MDLHFLAVFVALCHWQLSLYDTSKKQAKERLLDVEEAADIIYLKKWQVCTQKKLMRAYRRRKLVRGSLPLLDITTKVATFW